MREQIGVQNTKLSGLNASFREYLQILGFRCVPARVSRPLCLLCSVSFHCLQSRSWHPLGIEAVGSKRCVAAGTQPLRAEEPTCKGAHVRPRCGAACAGHGSERASPGATSASPPVPRSCVRRCGGARGLHPARGLGEGAGDRLEPGLELGAAAVVQPAALSLPTKGRPHPADARHGRRGGRLGLQPFWRWHNGFSSLVCLFLFLIVPPSPGQAGREAVPQPRSRHTPRAPQTPCPAGCHQPCAGQHSSWG